MTTSFGDSLKMARDRTGLTQKEVSKLTNLSQSQLSRYESNETCPTADIIKTLALLYNVSTDFLFGFQRNSSNGGIIAMETDVQIGLDLLLNLSPENRARTIGYMDALAMQELDAINATFLATEDDEEEDTDGNEDVKKSPEDSEENIED